MLYDVNYLSPFGLLITARQKTDFTTVLSSQKLIELTRLNRIVIIRGFEALSSSTLVTYAKKLGPLLEWEFGNVMEMKVQVAPKNYLFTHGHVPFHWDGAFHQEPRFLLFNCIEAPDPDTGGETLFSDTHRIWSDASAEEQNTWADYELTYHTEKLAHYGGKITVPLVQVHKDTKETILRFAEAVPASLPNPVNVTMPGINKNLAESFMNTMTLKCYDQRYCYTHSWQQNDFLIADNNVLLHARQAFKHFTPRHLRRIQVL